MADTSSNHERIVTPCSQHLYVSRNLTSALFSPDQTL